jgi:hypothetical protein
MNAILHCATAAAAALVCAGDAGAADPARPNEAPAPAPQYQQTDPDGGKSAPEQAAARDREYLAALKKCDALKGGDKPKCVNAAQRKFGRM